MAVVQWCDDAVVIAGGSDALGPNRNDKSEGEVRVGLHPAGIGWSGESTDISL